MSEWRELLRGQVVQVNLDPVVGSEIGKTRPAVVVQNDVGNRFSPTIIVVAITRFSKAKSRFPFCVPIAPGEGGLTAASIANTAQIRTVDRRRIADQLLGQLPPEVMQQIDAALVLSLGLPN